MENVYKTYKVYLYVGTPTYYKFWTTLLFHILQYNNDKRVCSGR